MNEKPEECNCCGSSDVVLSKYIVDTTIGGGGKTRHDVEFWFCGLCAGTQASSIYRYPNMQATNTEVLQALCYIGNLILKKLNEPEAL